MGLVTVTRTTRNLEKLLAKMERLCNEYVETGVFLEQGEHPYAQMSYVKLAYIHEQGAGDFPPRTVRPLISNSMNNTDFKLHVKNALNKHFLGKDSADQALSSIGFYMRELGKSFFGKVDMKYMFPNSPSTVGLKGGRDTPLVDEGHLKDAWAYRTSISGYIVDTKGL